MSLQLYKRVLNINGVAFLGGCCGTTPEHIKTLSDAVKGVVPKKKTKWIFKSFTCFTI